MIPKYFSYKFKTYFFHKTLTRIVSCSNFSATPSLNFEFYFLPKRVDLITYERLGKPSNLFSLFQIMMWRINSRYNFTTIVFFFQILPLIGYVGAHSDRYILQCSLNSFKPVWSTELTVNFEKSFITYFIYQSSRRIFY